MTVYTLFGQPASPATLTTDATAYTMGVQFSVNVSGSTLTGVWFFSASGATNLPATIALYAVSGTSLVHSETPSWSGAAGSGWVRSSFSSPPSLTASTNYKACVFYNPTGDNWYSHTASYWSSGAGSGGITNGPLSAPNNAGGDGGQDTFTQSASLSYPSTSFSAANYWVDPEVTTTASNVTSTGGLAMAAMAWQGTGAETIGSHGGLAMAAMAWHGTGTETGSNVTSTGHLAMAPMAWHGLSSSPAGPPVGGNQRQAGRSSTKKWLLYADL